MISTSPLRYPGGKTRFTNFIWEAIRSSGEQAKYSLNLCVWRWGCYSTTRNLAKLNASPLTTVPISIDFICTGIPIVRKSLIFQLLSDC